MRSPFPAAPARTGPAVTSWPALRSAPGQGTGVAVAIVVVAAALLLLLPAEVKAGRGVEAAAAARWVLGGVLALALVAGNNTTPSSLPPAHLTHCANPQCVRCRNYRRLSAVAAERVRSAATEARTADRAVLQRLLKAVEASTTAGPEGPCARGAWQRPTVLWLPHLACTPFPTAQHGAAVEMLQRPEVCTARVGGGAVSVRRSATSVGLATRPTTHPK